MDTRRGSVALLVGCLLACTAQTRGIAETEGKRAEVLQESLRPSSSAASPSFLPPSSNSSQAEGSQEHWRRVKGIFSNMESILEKLYEGEINSGHVPLSVIPKMMLIGDAVYGTKMIFKRLDPDLVVFLTQRLNSGFVGKYTKPLGEILTLLDARKVVDGLVSNFVVQTGHFLHYQAMTFANELEFVTELMLSSGFEQEEVSIVFKLLGLPSPPQEMASPLVEPPLDDPRRRSRDRRFSTNRKNSEYDYPMGGYGYSGGYSGGYEGNGGYGGGYSADGYGGGHDTGGYGGYGGYMQDMSKLDPFVILGGLAFLTLCSYVTFLVLSSKTRKRSVPDLSLDLSDLPNVNLVLEAMDRDSFGASKEGTDDLLTVIPHEVNLVWRNYKQDPSTRSCMQRYLCESFFSSTQPNLLLSQNDFMLRIIRSAAAQVLGEADAPRRADEGITAILDVQPRARDSCSAYGSLCPKDEKKDARKAYLR